MTLLLLLLLCPLLAAGLPAQTAQQSPKSFQELQEDFAILQNVHQKNAEDYLDFFKAVHEAFRTPDPEEAALQALRLRRQGLVLLESLERDQQRQVEFQNDLSLYSGKRQLLKQERSYIAIYLDKLQKYGAEQQSAIPALQKQLHQMDIQLTQLPPPRDFTSVHGVNFRLVVSKKLPAFYVSGEPLGEEQFRALTQAMDGALAAQELERLCQRFRQEGLSLPEAQTLARALGKIGGFPCTLPSPAQAKTLETLGMTPEKAVWLEGGKSDDVVEKEACQRFGAAMGQLWDPREVLASGRQSHILQELPWARYPELGCLLVTPALTGQHHRIAQLEQRLREEDEALLQEAAETGAPQEEPPPAEEAPPEAPPEPAGEEEPQPPAETLPEQAQEDAR
ncbi:MAG: hypothetical protein ACI4SG_02865 [Oligosphaeraceae bacterium]